MLALFAELLDQRVRLRVGLLFRLAAELDEQEAVPLGQHRLVLVVQVHERHVLDQDVVDALEPERLVGHHHRDVVACEAGVGEAEDEQAALGRAVDQADGRLEDRDAGALGARERGGDVEAVLGQEAVEVVAGDAARQLRVALADEVAVPVAEVAQLGVDLALGAAGRDQAGQLGLGRRPHLEAVAVVREDVELVDLVGRERPRPVNWDITEWTPQELLPIIPPSVQWSCVEGSGP